MFICQGPGTEVFFNVNCELNKYEFSRGTKDLLCLRTFPFPRMQSTLYMHLCITLLLLTLIKVYIYFYSTHLHAGELRRGGGAGGTCKHIYSFSWRGDQRHFWFTLNMIYMYNLDNSELSYVRK